MKHVLTLLTAHFWRFKHSSPPLCTLIRKWPVYLITYYVNNFLCGFPLPLIILQNENKISKNKTTTTTPYQFHDHINICICILPLEIIVVFSFHFGSYARNWIIWGMVGWEWMGPKQKVESKSVHLARFVILPTEFIFAIHQAPLHLDI